MRILERRKLQIFPDLRVVVRSKTINLKLEAPRPGDSLDAPFDLEGEAHDIYELWKRMGLDSSDFTAGGAMLFLKHLKRTYGRGKTMVSVVRPCVA